MDNPILNKLQPPRQIDERLIGQAKQMMQSKNPMVQMIINSLGGADPQQMFYTKCRELNIDPESILKHLR